LAFALVAAAAVSFSSWVATAWTRAFSSVVSSDSTVPDQVDSSAW